MPLDFSACENVLVKIQLSNNLPLTTVWSLALTVTVGRQIRISMAARPVLDTLFIFVAREEIPG